ncbi:hypothetical protein ACVBEJ_01930 [Porticoccus sp. GXU_MW_L64]
MSFKENSFKHISISRKMPPMSTKKLTTTNRYLTATERRSMRIRTIASSTAIETGEDIQAIEKKLIRETRSRYHVTLAG